MPPKYPIVGETWVDNLDRAVSLVGEKENFLFCGDTDPDSVSKKRLTVTIWVVVDIPVPHHIVWLLMMKKNSF